MEEAKPVVLTKPVRGREMLSKKGPLDKAAEVEKKKVETYYEGYVDGQLFLVPDSNLEAMKDMINFKMRPKTSVRYKHQTSYDIQYYDQFNEKLNELLAKIDDFQESGDFERIPNARESTITQESSEDKEEEPQEEKKKSDQDVREEVQEHSKEIKAKALELKIESNESVKSKIDEIKTEIMEELDKEYVEEKSSSSTPSSTIRESETVLPEEPTPLSTIMKQSEIEEKISQIPIEDEATAPEPVRDDELRVRLLISGHIKDGENPLYIVQEFDGMNDIFKDQKLDFRTSSSEENGIADVFISGKLYTENILVESEGNPSYLNTKPEKMMIDKEKSKIFDHSFQHDFKKEDYSVLLQGKFIKGKNDEITPSISFCISKTPTSSQPSNEEK